MPSAVEQGTSKQHAFESDQPAVTGVFRVMAAEAEAQPFDGLPEELALLVQLPYHDARKQAISAFERVYVRALLERCGGNVSHSARTAGLDRVYLHRLLRRHSLRRPKQRKRRVKAEGRHPTAAVRGDGDVRTTSEIAHEASRTGNMT